MKEIYLQIGMTVKIKNNTDYGNDAGLVKKITSDLPNYYNDRAFELDNNDGEIWVIEDFEFCVEYPELKMK